MRWSAARLLVVLFAFSSAAEPPQDAPVTVITPQAVSNLIERAGILMIEGEIQQYTEMLADDFKFNNVDGPIVKDAPNPIRKMDRAEYIKAMEASMRLFAFKKYETNIHTIKISPDGQQAEMTGDILQNLVFRKTGGFHLMEHEANVLFEVRNGHILVVRIQCVGKRFEHTPPPDEIQRDAREMH